jgi:uncharacterized protein YcbX
MSATLGRITIFPIKSLDGIDLDEGDVLPNGGLANDRRFAIVDSEGRCVNGKRTAAVHRIRAEYDLARMTVRFDATTEFSLLEDQSEIGRWLTNALGFACGLAENSSGGFPDDTDSPGPTLISIATLESVASWFPGLALDEARRRFRANLEIDVGEPFWEDRLIGPGDSTVPFQIGGVAFVGVNPCQRCVVPTRNAASGEVTPAFQNKFAAQRERRLPRWAPRDRFNHFYRVAVNTRLAPPAAAGRIRVGDPLSLTPHQPHS